MMQVKGMHSNEDPRRRLHRCAKRRAPYLEVRPRDQGEGVDWSSRDKTRSAAEPSELFMNRRGLEIPAHSGDRLRR